jgi:hypothetical protein
MAKRKQRGKDKPRSESTIKVLVPVDSSEFSDRAPDFVIDMAAGAAPLDIHLRSVQMPIDSGYVRRCVSDDDIDAYHRDEGMAVLQPYLARLDAVLMGFFAQRH